MTKRGGPGALNSKPCVQRACLTLKAQPLPSKPRSARSPRPDSPTYCYPSNNASSRRRRRGARRGATSWRRGARVPIIVPSAVVQ